MISALKTNGVIDKTCYGLVIIRKLIEIIRNVNDNIQKDSVSQLKKLDKIIPSLKEIKEQLKSNKENANQKWDK